MKLHTLKSTPGSTKERRRVGRGIGSGFGKTAGRGEKGQNSRSGGGVRPGFEGGQNPIYRRISKRGFNNVNKVEFEIVNIESLNRFEDGTVVNPELLKEAGLIKSSGKRVKVLGNGELERKLTVHAHKFSKNAQIAIETAGGKTEVI